MTQHGNRRNRRPYAQRTDRHTSSLLADHMVITPKYRARILKGDVADECERQIRWTCKMLDIDIIEMAVAEDHVHLFLQYPPKLSPSKITEKINPIHPGNCGNSSRTWCGGTKTDCGHPAASTARLARDLMSWRNTLPGRNVSLPDILQGGLGLPDPQHHAPRFKILQCLNYHAPVTSGLAPIQHDL